MRVRRHPWLLVAAAVSTLACQDRPVVEVTTSVAPARASATDQRAQRAAVRDAITEMARTVTSWLPAASSPAAVTEPEPRHTTASVHHPPRSPEELARLVHDVRRGSIDELTGPAGRLAAADAALWPQIRAYLLAERKAPKTSYGHVLSVIGGDVPNRYGHFALHWKRAHGHAVKLSEDWYQDLLAVRPAMISGLLRPVYRDCVLQSALLQAASRIGRTPALSADVVDTLLSTAYIHGGTFRDEVGRAIRSVGDEAVPHLIRASVLPDDHLRLDRYDPAMRRAAYAREQLDQMDRWHPSQAIRAVRANPRRLTAVLEAYGSTPRGEAADVLLDHADAAIPSVRAVARASFLAYVTGPAPHLVRRTVRLLGGHTTQAKAFLSHRERAELAIRERLSAQAPSLVEEPCETPEAGNDDRACAEQAERLTRSYFRWLDLQRHAREEQLVAQALAQSDAREAQQDLDRLLVTNPDLAGSARVIDYFAAVAQRAAQAQGAAAAVTLRKGAALVADRDPDLAREWIGRAMLQEATAAELSPRAQRVLRAAAAELALHDARVMPTGSAPDGSPRIDERWSSLLAAWAALMAGLACATLLARRLWRR